ncbi:integral membrane protein [Campylobacter sputorum subsp. bubulus]|uniref:Integral membrane protein n=1 Tax=Campylobacter sputorum subsp. sputorum TaxID=32024 RepID=A0A381DGR3_9BACT|nr:FUSC family protein [Campylobacter sputorum]ASM34942.1 putative membrane protein [Campylobacter sputorum aubsp. sputorum RM3237]KAB0581929.1 FUSC family protein [Campylobacter sputorum subsp. sputorum]QEL05133.1 FUSC domain-containing protein [Campylobacter sputorum subsp. sputorum]SUX09455.1 integral membrane protein [Campylobacter sputorum subsp. sputorum]SUX30801.1 integral membrane protein [Campylobacter sputorum subsp. bubulus]
MQILKKIFYEINNLFKINQTDRPWHMPLSTAISTSGPLFIGAISGHMAQATVASLAGLVFLYTLKTPIHHRMVVLMACSFGMIVSFVFGSFSHINPSLLPLILGIITTITTMIVRFYKLPTPGNFFFMMIATLAAFMPFKTEALIQISGYFMLGTIWACFVSFLYGLSTVKFIKPEPIPKIEYDGFDDVVLDSVILGVFVSLSVFLADFIGFDKPYWVPISTLAILQGMTLKSKWTRQIHRILGTCLGIILTYFLLSVYLNSYEIAILIAVLTFLIEFSVVRNYGIAAIFITPLTVYMAEINGVISGNATDLIVTRLEDIIFGSFVGFIGGVCLHSIKFRNIVKFIVLFLSKNRIND